MCVTDHKANVLVAYNREFWHLRNTTICDKKLHYTSGSYSLSPLDDLTSMIFSPQYILYKRAEGTSFCTDNLLRTA